MDKIIEDFNNEINIRTNKLISVKGSGKKIKMKKHFQILKQK